MFTTELNYLFDDLNLLDLLFNYYQAKLLLTSELTVFDYHNPELIKVIPEGNISTIIYRGNKIYLGGYRNYIIVYTTDFIRLDDIETIGSQYDIVIIDDNLYYYNNNTVYKMSLTNHRNIIYYQSPEYINSLLSSDNKLILICGKSVRIFDEFILSTKFMISTLLLNQSTLLLTQDTLYLVTRCGKLIIYNIDVNKYQVDISNKVKNIIKIQDKIYLSCTNNKIVVFHTDVVIDCKDNITSMVEYDNMLCVGTYGGILKFYDLINHRLINEFKIQNCCIKSLIPIW